MNLNNYSEQIEIVLKDGGVKQARYCVLDGKKYGIRIEMEDGLTRAMEVSELKDFFDHLEDARNYMKLLIKNTVTPYGFEDIKSDLYAGLAYE